MKYAVHFMPADKTVYVGDGATIMDAERIAELSFEYPCGGNGTCGKCLVNTIDTKDNKRRVRSCTTKIKDDLTVIFDDSPTNNQEKVLLNSSTDILIKSKDFNGIYVKEISMPEATIGDVRSDFERFTECCEKLGINNVQFNSTNSLSKLSAILAEDIFTFKAVFYNNILLDVRKDDFTPLGIAFDIGTTTIAAYLISLSNQKELYSLGELNAQVKYGSDVISRCIYSMDNFDEIHNCITSQLTELIERISEKCSVNKENIYAISVVGNTCMHHIFGGITPYSLINVPYTPTINTTLLFKGKDFFKDTVNNDSIIILLPIIAGFIGADTVSAMISANFLNNKEKTTLLLDIGTNGEMVLGNKDRRVACSTASGPAFEGAKITCGMRGAPGAIDHAFIKNNKFEFSTIDNLEPIGICGSGLMDIIAIMLSEQVILPSGRFNKKLSELSPLFSKIKDTENGKCFFITDKVFISQKDIREVQLAKGAIAAGIKIMTEKLGCNYSDINEVLIAGAFGNYMNPKSMCDLKMIPPELLSKIVPIGNAAGNGAKLCLYSNELLKAAESLSKSTEFIELATHDKFQERFIEQLDF